MREYEKKRFFRFIKVVYYFSLGASTLFFAPFAVLAISTNQFQIFPRLIPIFSAFMLVINLAMQSTLYIAYGTKFSLPASIIKVNLLIHEFFQNEKTEVTNYWKYTRPLVFGLMWICIITTVNFFQGGNSIFMRFIQGPIGLLPISFILGLFWTNRSIKYIVIYFFKHMTKIPRYISLVAYYVSTNTLLAALLYFVYEIVYKILKGAWLGVSVRNILEGYHLMTATFLTENLTTLLLLNTPVAILLFYSGVVSYVIHLTFRKISELSFNN